MRLSVTLNDKNYRLAKSLAREEDISISKAINLLLERKHKSEPTTKSASSKTRSGFTRVSGKQTVTSDDVAEFLAENS